VCVEYAKEGPGNLPIRFSVHSRGPEARFRNAWARGEDNRKPPLREVANAIKATHCKLGECPPHFDGTSEPFLTEHKSSTPRLWGQPNVSPYAKDVLHS
jgi:hypothetical protein